MTYLERLSSGEKVEYSEDNQDTIMEAIENIARNFQMTVYILLDESNNRAWISTDGSVFNYGDKVIELVRDKKGNWNPPGYEGNPIDIQLARLGHGSPNSQ